MESLPEIASIPGPVVLRPASCKRVQPSCNHGETPPSMRKISNRIMCFDWLLLSKVKALLFIFHLIKTSSRKDMQLCMLKPRKDCCLFHWKLRINLINIKIKLIIFLAVTVLKTLLYVGILVFWDKKIKC